MSDVERLERLGADDVLHLGEEILTSVMSAGSSVTATVPFSLDDDQATNARRWVEAMTEARRAGDPALSH